MSGSEPIPVPPALLVPAVALGGSAPSAAAVLTAEIRAVVGVAMLVPARGQVRDVLAHAAGALTPATVDPADGPLGAVSGGTFAEPVLVRVLGDEVSVSAEVCVAAESSAPDIARAVGSAVREWCRREHPGRRARIAVRIASVD
ncbi:hypothetical protein GSU69_15245 [Rathayibacter festucae]|uniref:Asp23/Gls24 family envelope stress response protein n=1 Tax=Rathayibacter festucae TaxID=110937 RepID=A0ABX6H2I3_9MICO|nr:hypothetical protein [Rathayibacter festucae]QHC63902.1 hypothetical protein GSU69_15245 [Rathayibacter festucae]